MAADEAVVAAALMAGVLVVETLLGPLHPANSTAVPTSPRTPMIPVR
ncbi:hypothetical protein [Acidipropionibacterium thoenii]|nr:hypothetical protein [Acidipropionibacterium thoenii]